MKLEAMLLDEQAEPPVLTGEVSVRFTVPPSEQELLRFASRHSLRLVRRNEFVPQQAVFQPLADSDLPELVRKLAREAGVRTAWANTLSQYRRAAGF